MALKDKFAKARAAAAGLVTQHGSKIDQGITKIGDVANTKTGGRYQDQIRKGSEQARSGLDKIKSERPDIDGSGPTTSEPR